MLQCFFFCQGQVSSTYARTHVPTPRRFLSKPTAAFYVYISSCLSLLVFLLFLCVFFCMYQTIEVYEMKKKKIYIKLCIEIKKGGRRVHREPSTGNMIRQNVSCCFEHEEEFAKKPNSSHHLFGSLPSVWPSLGWFLGSKLLSKRIEWRPSGTAWKTSTRKLSSRWSRPFRPDSLNEAKDDFWWASSVLARSSPFQPGFGSNSSHSPPGLFPCGLSMAFLTERSRKVCGSWPTSVATVQCPTNSGWMIWWDTLCTPFFSCRTSLGSTVTPCITRGQTIWLRVNHTCRARLAVRWSRGVSRFMTTLGRAWLVSTTLQQAICLAGHCTFWVAGLAVRCVGPPTISSHQSQTSSFHKSGIWRCGFRRLALSPCWLSLVTCVIFTDSGQWPRCMVAPTWWWTPGWSCTHTCTTRTRTPRTMTHAPGTGQRELFAPSNATTRKSSTGFILRSVAHTSFTISSQHCLTTTHARPGPSWRRNTRRSTELTTVRSGRPSTQQQSDVPSSRRPLAVQESGALPTKSAKRNFYVSLFFSRW